MTTKAARSGGYDSKGRTSESSAAIPAVQTRSRGLTTGNRELNAKLMTKARDLEKEYEEHRHRLSCDQTDSGRWIKAPLEQGKEKEGDCVGRNYSRGKMYSKYMEKRVTRLRTEHWSNRAAMNDAKLRALHDDIQRCRVKLPGKIVFSEGNKDVDSGAQPLLEKLWSISVLSSQTTEEQGIDIRQREEDDVLPISRSHKPRKVSLVGNRPSSSIARPRTFPISQPSNKMMSSTSWKRRSNPQNPFDLRKEYGKPPPVIGRKTNHSIVKDGVRTRNAIEGSQKSHLSLMKRSASPLGRRNPSARKPTEVKIDARKEVSQSSDERSSMSLESGSFIRQAKPRKNLYQPRNDNSGHSISVESSDLLRKTEGDVLVMRFDEEESHPELIEKSYQGIDLNPLHGNVSEANPGKESSFNLQREQDYNSSMEQMVDDGYTGTRCSSISQNEEDTRVGHSMVPAERIKDCVTERTCDHCNWVNFTVPRSSLRSDDSKNLESSDSNSSESQFRAEPSMNSAFEHLNSTSVTEMIPAISNVETPKAGTLASNSPHGRSRIGISRSSKRFLIFSKRSRGDDSLEDPISTMTCEGDEEEIFTEILVREEQVRSPRFPVPASMGKIKRNGGSLSGRSPKATGSCFSLSSLWCRGDDINPRQPIPRERICR